MRRLELPPLEQLKLNAAELIRHPGATERDRRQAEAAVELAQAGLLDVCEAHERVSQGRALIRDRWNQENAA